MDEKPDKIVQHIESKRDVLGRNLDELQNKVRETTDWRVQFDRHPYVLMSAAMGGGMLLSSMLGGSSSRPRGYRSRNSASMPQTGSYYLNNESSSSQHFSQPSHQSQQPQHMSSGYQQERQKAWTVFDNIKGALIGLAAAKAQDYLNEMLPGFREHFREVSGQSGGGMRHESNQSWPEPQRPQNWGQGAQNQPHMGERPFQGPGQGMHNQGQWPQERNWERDREHQHPGAFDQPGGFRR